MSMNVIYVIENILKYAKIDADKQVLSYREPDDFKKLWGLDGSGTSIDPKKTIVIVWDGKPNLSDRKNVVNIADSLTPIDWALSWSHNMLVNEKGGNTPPFHIFIIDLYSHTIPQAFGCQMADSLTSNLPWVTIMRPFAGSAVNVGDDPENLKQLDQDLMNKLFTPNDLEMPDNKAKEIVRAFALAWQGRLARSGDHHDVNNLLGPLCLLGGFKNEDSQQGSLGPKALLQHIRWLGETKQEQSGGGQGQGEGNDSWFDAGTLAKRLERDIRFVLVDDQADHGWGDVVCRALGLENSDKKIDEKLQKCSNIIESPIELWATDEPTNLIKILKEKIESLEGTSARDARFDLKLTSLEKTNDKNDGEDSKETPEPLEVLLLDLRLFGNHREEAGYFNKVLELVDKLNKSHVDSNWPWAPLTDEREKKEKKELKSLDGLRGWVEKYVKAETDADIENMRREDTYLTLLTLLPRVIATLDMSLPIVIFSSTGQRTVTEKFRDYGNIICAFDKPRFGSYQAEDIYEDTKAKWRAAMRQLSDVLSARSVVNFIQQYATQPPRLPMIGDDKNEIIIEMYFDESGCEFKKNKEGKWKDLTVSALVIVGLKDKVQDLKNEIHQIANLGHTVDKEGIRSKVGDFSTKLISNEYTYAFLVEMKGKKDSEFQVKNTPFPDRDSDGIEGLGVAYNLFREILSTITEAVIYHHSAHYITNSSNTECFLNFATRVQPIENKIDNNLALQLKEKLGIEYDDIKKTGDRYIRFFNIGDAYPLVQLVASQYSKNTRFRPKISHARAYKINNYSNKSKRQCFHQIADAIASSKSSKNIMELKDRGFVGNITIESVGLMVRAVRLAANGHVGKAFSLAASGFEGIRRDGTAFKRDNDIRRRLMGRLTHFIPLMKSADLVNLIRNMEE